MLETLHSEQCPLAVTVGSHLAVDKVVSLLSDNHGVTLRIEGGASFKPRLPRDCYVLLQRKLWMERETGK